MIWSYQVVIDCSEDPEQTASFWRRGVRYAPEEVGPEVWEWIQREHPEWLGTRSVAEDERRRHPRLYLQRVPEPKTGRNRIRFVVGTPDVGAERARLIELGATPIGDMELADPGGNEFTIGAADDLAFSELVVDALDPDGQAGFWRSALTFGGEGGRCEPPDAWLRLVDGELIAHGQRLARLMPEDKAPGERILARRTPAVVFQPSDAPKAIKNRIHLDLNCVDEADFAEERSRLLAMGASVVEPGDDLVLPELQPGQAFAVMRDPEGNEFCLQPVFGRVRG